jgi:hypothetical protein
MSAGQYFAIRHNRVSYGGQLTHVLPKIRCTEDMARLIARYGNENGETVAQACRTLIQEALRARYP